MGYNPCARSRVVVPELPIYPSTSQHAGWALSQQRDELLRARGEYPDRAREAVAARTAECISETLRLTGVAASLPEVTRVLDGKVEVDSPHRDVILGQRRALGVLREVARASSSPDAPLILEVHKLSSPPKGGRFRGRPARPRFATATPSAPEIIPAQMDDLADWLGAPSVRALRPHERAALTFTRLLEIAPFESGNFRVAHLLMNFYAFQEDFPPFFLRSEDADEIRQEIERAMRFDTSPLVTRLTLAQSMSLDACLRAVRKGTAG